MLLTVSTTHAPATDLGFLLHKNPARMQAFDLAFGRAHVFYPEASESRCTAALLLEVDPVGLVGRMLALHNPVCKLLYREVLMATNLALDDKLIARALKAGGHKTKREAVTAALQEYVKMQGRRQLLALEGRVDFDPAYDYKAARRRGRRR